MKRQNRGFTAFELLAVLVVFSFMIAMGAPLAKSYTDNLTAQAAAQHALQVSDAADNYIKDNYAAITAVATPTSPAVITVSMLQSTNYLPTSFSATNQYEQSYQILALQPTANQLQTLIVTTGGETIDEHSLREVAKRIGAMGGYISSASASTATGSMNSWTMPLSSYGIAPGGGHLAMAQFFKDGSLVSDYLYRGTVTGHPELNTMNTALNMGSNDVTNAGTVNSQHVSVSSTATVNGRLTSNVPTDWALAPNSNNWSMVTGDGSGNQNAALQTNAGSISVNDVYIRSLGKWASQLGSPPRITWMYTNANGWWTYNWGRKPLFAMVELADCGIGNTGGYWQVVEYNAAGTAITGGMNIGGSNYNSGPDGGSGMCNMQSATIPFMDGAVTLHIYPVGNYLQYANYVEIVDQ